MAQDSDIDHEIAAGLEPELTDIWCPFSRAKSSRPDARSCACQAGSGVVRVYRVTVERCELPP
jgi:hypothetical protein